MGNEKKTIIEILRENLQTVVNWLNFAEAKNAAIIAINIAFISMINDINIIRNNNFIFALVAGIAVLSSLIALIAFFPKSTKGININCNLGTDKNLLFYEDISKYGTDEYVCTLYKKYIDKDILPNNLSSLEKDLAEEIIVNSKIAVRKYTLFKLALIFECVALGICFLILLQKILIFI